MLMQRTAATYIPEKVTIDTSIGNAALFFCVANAVIKPIIATEKITNPKPVQNTEFFSTVRIKERAT